MSIMAPIQNCKFKYECPKDWFDLDITDDDAIRFCQKCRQNVYFCKNDKELKKAIKQDRCVAIFSGGNDISMTVGIPEAPYNYKTDK